MTTHGQHSWDQLPMEPPPMEQLDVPLYDTQRIKSGDRVAFFQRPGGRGFEFTNVQTCGALSYPKSFDVRALELEFEGDVEPDTSWVEFWIGEEMVLKEALKGAAKYTHLFTWPIMVKIPTVQNFRVYLDATTAGQELVETKLRCNLLGTLHRERRLK